jgi:hypothetical protein
MQNRVSGRDAVGGYVTGNLLIGLIAVAWRWFRA